MSYSIGVEWIHAYNNLNALHHEHEDAGGFYDELRLHDGATGLFTWGDSAAWEDDFKANARGGHADQWSSAPTSSASPGTAARAASLPQRHARTTPRSAATSPRRPPATTATCASATTTSSGCALEVCNTLQMDATPAAAPTATCSTAGPTPSRGCTRSSASRRRASTSPTPGRLFAAAMDGRWISVAYGLPDVHSGSVADARRRRLVLDGAVRASRATSSPRCCSPTAQGTNTAPTSCTGTASAPTPSADSQLVLLDLDPARLLTPPTQNGPRTMTTMTVARVRPTALDDDRVRARRVRPRCAASCVRTEEAIARGPDGAVVHGQPGNRTAGLTTWCDNRAAAPHLPPETGQRCATSSRRGGRGASSSS